MTIQLTEEQQRAVDSAGATLTQVVDPRTSAAYVLIPVDDYETVREILRDERQQKTIRMVGLRNAAGRIEEEP
jgi:hypothetical protein